MSPTAALVLGHISPRGARRDAVYIHNRVERWGVVSDATDVVGYDATEEFFGRQTPLKRLQGVLHAYPWLSPMFVLVFVVVVFSTISSNFSQASNLGTITQQTAVVGTLAIGQTIIILTAGIDLSCGAIMVFTQLQMA